MKTLTLNPDLIPTVINALLHKRNGLIEHLNNIPKDSSNAIALIQQDINDINSVFDFINTKLKTDY